MGLIHTTKISKITPENHPQKKATYRETDLLRILYSTSVLMKFAYAKCEFYDEGEREEILVVAIDSSNKIIPNSFAAKPCPRCNGDTGGKDNSTILVNTTFHPIPRIQDIPMLHTTFSKQDIWL